MIVETALAEQVAVEARDAITGVWRDLNVMLTGVNVTRGNNSNGATDTLTVGAGDLSMVGPIDLGVDTALRPGSGVRIRHKVSLAVAFTGTIIDVNQSFTWDKGKSRRTTHTYVACSDVVQALANIKRHGVISPGGRQTWAERINQLNQSAGTVSVTAPASNTRLMYSWPSAWPLPWTTGVDGWTEQTPGNAANGYQLSAVTRPGTREILSRAVNPSTDPFSGTSLSVAQNDYGIKRTFTGLTVGKSYEMTFSMAVDTNPVEIPNARWWRVQVDGKAWGAETYIAPQPDGSTYSQPLARLQFVATATSHIIRITNARAFSIPPSNYGVVDSWITPGSFSELGIPDEYLLQDVVYESSLLNHYQLACDSVGARFWVDRSNTVQFRRAAEDTGIVAKFTDRVGPDVLAGYTEDVRNHIMDPATTNVANWTLSSSTSSLVAGWLRVTATASPAHVWGNITGGSTYTPLKPGDKFAARLYARSGDANAVWAQLKVTLTNSSGQPVATRVGPITALPTNNATTLLQLFGTVNEAGVVNGQMSLHLYSSLAGAAPAAGALLETTQWALLTGNNAPTSGTVPYFTGATAAAGDYMYQWAAAVNASASIRKAKFYAPPGDLTYVDVYPSFDTRSVVNTLTMSQHGLTLNGDGEAVADDYARVITDPDSVNAWGEREAQIDTCLWLGFQHELDLDMRAREVFTERAEAGYAVTRLRWNAAESLGYAFSLDIGSRVRVEFDGAEQTCRILRIKHSLTGSRWLMDIWFTDIELGPTFDELSDYYSGKTFDQWSDIFTGQTFDQMNKRPLQ